MISSQWFNIYIYTCRWGYVCDDIRSPGTYKRLAQVACRSLDEDYVDGFAKGGVQNDAEDGE